MKRRDKKGRVLRTGENQRKDGRYAYAYMEHGKLKFAYSWKLEKTDVLPTGCKPCISLREKEFLIQRNLEDGIENANKMTVLQLVEKYISQKTGVRHNTMANYNFVINIIKKESFGSKRIDRVKLSDAKGWFIKMQREDKRGFSSIHCIRGIVRPAFQMAVDDDLIRKNPFEFPLSTVVINDSVTRKAITIKQQNDFLHFIRNDTHYRRYYDGMFVLFHTGLRISEFCGLTVENVKMEERKIIIDHQLQRTRAGEYVIEDTKTSAGTRILPMSDEVYQSFQNILAKRKQSTVSVEGYSNFLFVDKKNKPEVALHWENHFRWALQKYNRTHQEQQLPKITPHVCRHTYCSNMARLGMNPKTLQYLMGHSDISVTLNTYSHVNYEDAKNELTRIINRKV